MTGTAPSKGQIRPLDVTALRAAVKARHGLRLGADDPILAIYTMMDLLTEQTCLRLTDALAIALTEGLNNARSTSEGIVNQGADHIANHATQVLAKILGDRGSALQTSIINATEAKGALV